MFLEPAEFSDIGGRLLGHFVPANLERGKELYASSLKRVTTVSNE